MISAFGIDHGGVSKGLPRALRDFAVPAAGRFGSYSNLRTARWITGKNNGQTAKTAGSALKVMGDRVLAEGSKGLIGTPRQNMRVAMLKHDRTELLNTPRKKSW